MKANSGRRGAPGGMGRREAAAGVILCLAFVLAACQPISEPWVGDGEMQAERERTDREQAVLRDRLARGQTDR